MKSYKVRYELDATRWWVASIASVPGCHTQGRTIEQASERIREALALSVGDKVAASAVLVSDIRLPAPVLKVVAAAKKTRAQVERIEKASHAASRTAVSVLVKHGLSYRDVGTLLGVTRQRAHQLLAE